MYHHYLENSSLIHRVVFFPQNVSKFVLFCFLVSIVSVLIVVAITLPLLKQNVVLLSLTAMVIIQLSSEMLYGFICV